jgi:histidine ammonia-lyase
VIEALLFVGWAVERRIHYLLSGKYKHIPINAATKDNKLGLIQVPKLVTNILEEARLRLARRTFAAGNSTSYGIEDIWTLTSILVENLKYALDSIATILSIEKLIFDYIEDYDYTKFKNNLKIIGLKDNPEVELDYYKHISTIVKRCKK